MPICLYRPVHTKASPPSGIHSNHAFQPYPLKLSIFYLDKYELLKIKRFFKFRELNSFTFCESPKIYLISTLIRTKQLTKLFQILENA